MIEASLRFAGFASTIVVFGNKFSYEAKSSRHTLSIFEVGKHPQPVFHLFVYDLAYINVSSMKIWSDNEYKKEMARLSKD